MKSVKNNLTHQCLHAAVFNLHHNMDLRVQKRYGRWHTVCIQDSPVSLIYTCKNVKLGCLCNIAHCFTDFLLSFSVCFYDGRNLYHHIFCVHTVCLIFNLLCALHLPVHSQWETPWPILKTIRRCSNNENELGDLPYLSVLIRCLR